MNLHQSTISALVGLAAVAVVLAATDATAGDSKNTVTDMGKGAPGPGLSMPKMNATNGRKLFASKGCVVCHSINGVGGDDAPALDAKTMKPHMNPFEFAARMWRGAGAMIAMQQDELGGQIELNGSELADIIAFAHDKSEQAKFSEADIPENIKSKMEHDDDEGGEKGGHMGGMDRDKDAMPHRGGMMNGHMK